MMSNHSDSKGASVFTKVYLSNLSYKGSKINLFRAGYPKVENFHSIGAVSTGLWGCVFGFKLFSD